MRRSLTLTSLFLSSSLAAQSVVVPAAAANPSAPSLAWAPGSGLDERHVILVDMPPALHGRTLTELTFLRDDSIYPFRGGAVDLVVRMSVAPHSAVRANAEFGRNHGAAPTTVFQGRIAIPPSPSAATRRVSWSNVSDTVSIPFTTSFPFTAGTLAIEFESRPVDGQEPGYWASDAVLEPTTGIATWIGASCAPSTVTRMPEDIHSSLGVSPQGLMPGATANFSARGAIGATSVFALGFQSTDLDLGMLGLGGVGCRLRVLADIADYGAFASRAPLRGGFADYALQIPVDPGLLNASFFVQSIEFGVPIYTSELLHCTIGGAVPTLGVSMVYGDIKNGVLPTRGSVITNRGPVLRFAYR